MTRPALAALLARPLAVSVLIATPVTAHADVDWARGLVTADGIGVASRSAPTPAAARGPARRLAEEAAKKKLATQLAPLPLAEGGTLGAKLATDAALETAIAQTVTAAAIVVAATPETDGSWTVTMAVPIESIRQALVGPRVLAAPGDEGPPVVVVEGASVAKPAIGYKLGALSAATIFVKEVPAWAKDAPRIKAKGAKHGVIDVAASKASDATLFVIVTK